MRSQRWGTLQNARFADNCAPYPLNVGVCRRMPPEAERGAKCWKAQLTC